MWILKERYVIISLYIDFFLTDAFGKEGFS